MSSETNWISTTYERDPEVERVCFIQQYVLARANMVHAFNPMVAADEAAEVWDKHLKPKEAQN